MAPQTADDMDVAAPPDADAPRRGFDLRNRKVLVAALLLFVMATEAALIYLVLPQPVGGGSTADDASLLPDDASSTGADTAEVDLGQFQCTNSVAVRGSIVHVSFDLSATVARSQAMAFADAVKNLHRARVRQAVIQVARSSSMEDLRDPQLAVLKRKIREEVNKALAKSYVNEVIVSDFRIMEQ